MEPRARKIIDYVLNKCLYERDATTLLVPNPYPLKTTALEHKFFYR